MDNLMFTAVFSMAGMAILFAAMLGFADKKLKVEENPKVDEINHILPGLNCGACGYMSCHDFAEHIVSDGVDPGKCRVIGEEHREELFKAAGREEKEAAYPVVALVHCAAETKDKKPDNEYRGVYNCRAANLVFGAGMKCEYGCMGFGDCAEVCPFDAIRMKDGLPGVDPEKCTGCGKCAEACPRNVISIQEKKQEKLFYVACSSHDNALRVRQICPVGCIACGICEKISPEGVFKVTDNLSRADYSKQDKQEEIRGIAGKCPTKVIKELSGCGDKKSRGGDTA